MAYTYSFYTGQGGNAGPVALTSDTEAGLKQQYVDWAISNSANLDALQSVGGVAPSLSEDERRAIFSASTRKASPENLNLIAALTGKPAADYSNYLSSDFAPIAQNKPGGEVDPRLQASPYEGKFTGANGEPTAIAQGDPNYRAPQGVLQNPKVPYAESQAQLQAQLNPKMVIGDGINTPGVQPQTQAPVFSQLGGQQVAGQQVSGGVAPQQQQQPQGVGTIPQDPGSLPTFTRNLQPGDKGLDVTTLQQYLMSQGFNIPAGATGYYGDQTKAAVAAWQASNGIDTAGYSGYFGPRSQNFLKNLQQQQAQQQQLEQQYKTAPVVDNLTQQFGFQLDPQLASNFAVQDPIQFVSSVFDKLYTSSGLPELKAKIESTTKDLEAISIEESDKIAAINDDPWLTDGLRRSRIDSIKNKYAGRKAVFADTLKYSNDLFESGQNQARFITQQALQSYNDQVDFQQQVYLKAMDSSASLAELKYKMATDKNYSKFKEVNGGIFDLESGSWVVQPKQSGGDGGTGGLYSEFDFRTANAVLGQVSKFEDNQVVKTYNNLLQAVNTINKIDPNTKNPADHQAVVYSFAKALDPDSVVREGEYATIKKYAQSLLSRYGKEISNAVTGTGFLSAGAIAAIQKTMNDKISSYEPQYQNIYNNYSKNIDQTAGKPGTGAQYLPDYTKGYSGSSQSDEDLIKEAQSQGITITPGAGSTPSSISPSFWQNAYGVLFGD